MGQFKRHSAVSVQPTIPLRTTENPAEGPRCHFVLLKLVSRVDIWTNWAPQILFPENLELEVEDIHQPLWDSRSKACELGKEVVAVINNSTQRPRESQVLTGEWNRRWSSRGERQGQLPQLLLTAQPQPLCQAPSHTSDASPSNPRFHQLSFLWVLVTCNQKKLETTLSTNLDCLAGQQDNFSINSKNNDTVMTVRGFWTFWFRRHCKILGNSVIVFLGLASQETTCKSNWPEKVVKDLSYYFSPGGQCGHTPQVDSILSSRARSTGPHSMTVRLTNCVLHQGSSHYKWWRASFWFIGFVFILLCVCFPIHCSVILSQNTKV